MAQDWDALEFVRRFRDGEFDGHWLEAINQLSPEQFRDLERFLLEHTVPDRARETQSGMPEH